MAPKVPSIKLSNGQEMPMLGLGTYAVSWCLHRPSEDRAGLFMTFSEYVLEYRKNTFFIKKSGWRVDKIEGTLRKND